VDATAAAVATAEAQPAAAPAAEPMAVALAADDAVAAPVAQPFVLPMDALAELARAAGLEWVNSDADKVSAVQAAIAAEPAPVRVPRVIKPVVLIDEGPLVLVETRKDLATLTLPFEAAPAPSAPAVQA
jgi:ribonuclease E